MKPLRTDDIRQAYLDFFRKHGHAVIPSASLLPENDPTTLFTGSGMQPMLTYLLGEKHSLGKRIADSQKCFRSQDIEEVGDNRHTTYFEMLGNWSLGDYFKEEQIPWMFSFLTEVLGLDPQRIFVTAFKGNADVPRDDDSVRIWQNVLKAAGVDAEARNDAERRGMQGGRIFYYDETKNWWSRTGAPSLMPVGEPGGPDSEMFWDFGADRSFHEQSRLADQPCHVNCDCGRFLEIGNNVFMEYIRTGKGFEKLSQQNVDFGGGLERLSAAVCDDPDIFRIDLFRPALMVLQELSGKEYGAGEEETRAFRVILDHLRGATLLTADGAPPSNKDQGYFTRRMLRRSIRFASLLDITEPFCARTAAAVIETYRKAYPDLLKQQEMVLAAFAAEEEQFQSTLRRGERELMEHIEKEGEVDGTKAFYFFETYGFPRELTEELLREHGGQLKDPGSFEGARKRHQEQSRDGAIGKFAGGLADHSAETTKLHTATHLLGAALRKVLGNHVHQKGSNVTADRLRFDFSHPKKMTPKEMKKVEDLVNDAIKHDLPVSYNLMTVEEAKKAGAIGVFEEKYASIGLSTGGEKVKVYRMGDFSLEICGGPHVARTGVLGKLGILKEESVSAGVRRIKAVVEGGSSKVEVAQEAV